MFLPRPFLEKLDRALMLTAAERIALANVPVHLTTIRADQDVVRAGDRPSRCVVVVEGLLATSKVSVGGKRQITALHIVGDAPDLLSLHLEVLDSDVRTVSESRLAFIEHASLRALCEDHPRIAAALWKATLVDAAIFREWVVNVGQRTAQSCLAHLLCEMFVRMDAAGLAKDGSCALPLTQTHLSEATGMSVVHVNRTLQEIRARGLITFAGGALTIHDWPALSDLAEFQSDYLHLGGEGVLVHSSKLSRALRYAGT